MTSEGGGKLNLGSPQFRRCVKALKEIDIELAFLALLTREGLKPLSRWEKPLDNDGLELLHQMGLLTSQIRRTVKTGKEVIETIFSVSSAYIDIYESRFADTPIDKSADTIRFEGFLFGFPPCCVDQYIKQPYTKNDLSPEQQKILFHWVCKNCSITPLLMPTYEKMYSFLCSI